MTNTTPPSYSMEGNEIVSVGKIANWQKGYRAINAYAATIFRTDPYHILGLQHLSNRDADWIRQPGHNALTPRTDDWARTPITAVMNVAQQATARDNNLGADKLWRKEIGIIQFRSQSHRTYNLRDISRAKPTWYRCDQHDTFTNSCFFRHNRRSCIFDGLQPTQSFIRSPYSLGRHNRLFRQIR